MRSDETWKLASCRFGAIDDKGHEEERKRQVFRIKVQDEEADLARRIVLCEGVCVRKRECGEERVAVEEEACDCLELS
jgi:stress response protein YsnF